MIVAPGSLDICPPRSLRKMHLADDTVGSPITMELFSLENTMLHAFLPGVRQGSSSAFPPCLGAPVLTRRVRSRLLPGSHRRLSFNRPATTAAFAQWAQRFDLRTPRGHFSARRSGAVVLLQDTVVVGRGCSRFTPWVNRWAFSRSDWPLFPCHTHHCAHP